VATLRAWWFAHFWIELGALPMRTQPTLDSSVYQRDGMDGHDDLDAARGLLIGAALTLVVWLLLRSL
jgi:hypothetical protein